MNLLAAFAAIFLLALVVLILLDGYGRHMGNPDPTDWKAILLIALAAGAIGAGGLGVAWEIIKFVWGLFA